MSVFMNSSQDLKRLHYYIHHKTNKNHIIALSIATKCQTTLQIFHKTAFEELEHTEAVMHIHLNPPVCTLRLAYLHLC